jgi:hypothetical protein
MHILISCIIIPALLAALVFWLLTRKAADASASPAHQFHFVVNDRQFVAPPGITQITYSDVVSYTGRPGLNYTITYVAGRVSGDLQPGQSVKLIEGMVFYAFVRS